MPRLSKTVNLKASKNHYFMLAVSVIAFIIAMLLSFPKIAPKVFGDELGKKVQATAKIIAINAGALMAVLIASMFVPGIGQGLAFLGALVVLGLTVYQTSLIWRDKKKLTMSDQEGMQLFPHGDTPPDYTPQGGGATGTW